MNDYWQLILAATAGVGLGLIFYGGLYFTVIRGLHSEHPVYWFFSSFVLRISLVMAGLYFVGDGHWQRIIACLAGIAVTGVVIRVWQQASASGDDPVRPHAP